MAHLAYRLDLSAGRGCRGTSPGAYLDMDHDIRILFRVRCSTGWLVCGALWLDTARARIVRLWLGRVKRRVRDTVLVFPWDRAWCATHSRDTSSFAGQFVKGIPKCLPTGSPLQTYPGGFVADDDHQYLHHHKH